MHTYERYIIGWDDKKKVIETVICDSFETAEYLAKSIIAREYPKDQWKITIAKDPDTNVMAVMAERKKPDAAGRYEEEFISIFETTPVTMEIIKNAEKLTDNGSNRQDIRFEIF